jgi:hypothetical protein
MRRRIGAIAHGPIAVIAASDAIGRSAGENFDLSDRSKWL